MKTDEQLQIEANTQYARQLQDAVGFLCHDPLDQIAALLTAATAITQRHMGPTVAAADALSTMLAPTLEEWSHLKLKRGETH